MSTNNDAGSDKAETFVFHGAVKLSNLQGM